METSLRKEFEHLLPARRAQVAWLALLAAFAWCHWSSIHRLTRVWWSQEDYQHGFVVPLFALFLLWIRRDMIPQGPTRGSLWGLPLFGVWALMRWVAIYYNYGVLPELSMLPFLAGVAVFVGGWQGLRWAWPAIVFLFFMLPLPGVVQDFARDKLQTVATILSVFVIQTLGIPAVAQGNVIQLTEKPLEVAQACSGLRMMMLFFAICVGAAFVARRPLWEKVVMIVSAAPIAVVSNVARIVLTAVLYELARQWPSLIDAETAETFMHNVAGLLMMPIGLALLLAEMSLLSKLLISPGLSGPLVARSVLAGGAIEGAAQRGLRRKRPS